MSRTLRTFATAVALMVGLLGTAVAFAGTSSAAETVHGTVSANSAQIWPTASSHNTGAALSTSARTMVLSSATSGNVHPSAVFLCQGQFVSAFQFNFVCSVSSGLVAIQGLCADGSTITTNFFGPPGASGFVFCGSGLVAVRALTIG